MRYITRFLLAGLVSVLCVASATQPADADGSTTSRMIVGCCR